MKTIITLFAVISLACWIALPANAEGLPPPAMRIYKCHIEGRTVYSDDPCLQAERVDIVPNSGVNQLSGHKREGADVRHENTQRQLGRALRPLSGKNDRQFASDVRRARLSAQAKRSCRRLDQQLPELEKMQGQATGKRLENLQHQLLQLRTEYRHLNC